MSFIGNMIRINSTLTNNYNPVQDNLEHANTDKKTKTQNHKLSNLEEQSSKFSIKNLMEKSESLETHKKGFFIISDELKDDEDDMSIKLKRDILVNKLMYDKSIIIDKQMQGSIHEQVLANLYLSLSNDSRKILLENNTPDSEYNVFHNIIGFNKENFEKKDHITNSVILNLCNNFLKIDDSI